MVFHSVLSAFAAFRLASSYRKMHDMIPQSFHLVRPTCAFITLITVAPCLQAQDAEDDFSIFEEVVVTAEKRSESLQDLSQSVTALTGAQLDQKNIVDFVDLSSLAPGLTITKNAGYRTVVAIRGVGNEANQNDIANPSVSYHLDGVYIASPFALQTDFIDVAQIEILRGPQGTLFGRNTTAGAVSFVTRKPSQEFNAEVIAKVGDYGVSTFEGAVGGGLTDTLSGRVAVKWDHQGEGFMTNRINGGKTSVGETDTLAMRASLRWELENMDINFNVHGGRDRSQNEPWVGIGRNTPDVITTVAPELPNGGKYRSGCAADMSTTDISFYIANCVNVNNYRDPYADPRVGEFSQEPKLESDSFGSLLNISWDLGATTLTSISAYESKDSITEEDFDGGPYRVGDSSYANDLSVFSQEVRLSNNEPTFDKMDWVIGALFYQDNMHVQDLYGYTDRVNHDVLVDFEQDTTSTAIFAHSETLLSESVKVIAALRYTSDDIAFDGGTYMVNKDSDYVGDATFFSEAPLLQDDEINTQELTGKLGLEYAASDDLMVYASYSRGYKAGVWNGFWTYLPDDHNATDPEYIDAYEVGFKSTLLDSTLQLNGAIYLYDYTDMQMFADLPAGNFAIFNAGQADVNGAELDLWWRPMEGLDIKAGLGINNAEISGGIGLTQFDKATPPNTPELTYNALVRYHWTLGNGMTAHVQSDVAYQDEVFFSLDNIKPTSEEAYTLINLRAGIEAEDESWSADIYVKNASDELVFTEILSSGSAGALSGQVNAPRTIGASLTYRWQ